MSERLQGHRTKLNANKMTCDGRCSSRWKQPVVSSFSGVAWTWAVTLTPWRNLADCSWTHVAPRPRERHGRHQWTAAMEERRERVLTPSAGAAAYRGRRHAGSRWRGTVAQCHGDSGKCFDWLPKVKHPWSVPVPHIWQKSTHYWWNRALTG